MNPHFNGITLGQPQTSLTSGARPSMAQTANSEGAQGKDENDPQHLECAMVGGADLIDCSHIDYDLTQ